MVGNGTIIFMTDINRCDIMKTVKNRFAEVLISIEG